MSGIPPIAGSLGSVMSLTVVLALMVSSGCSESTATVATFPTAGQVLKGGRPINYASVVLHPVDGGSGDFTKPRGTTDAEGRFQLTTFEGGDGAPAGKYFVTVEQWVTPKPDEGPRNQLKSKFADPKTSGIEVTISQGENTLPVIAVD